MSSQKAALFTAPGVPVTVQQRHVPQPQAGHVLVKVNAAGVNPLDGFATAAKIPFLQWPGINGWDGAGVVEALGDGVQDFSVGERVFFQGDPTKLDSSVFQQYTLVSADLLAKTPSGMSDEAAATVGSAAATALAGLNTAQVYDFKVPWERGGDKVGEGKAIIVFGGSSGVGQFALQLAALGGFHVVSNSSAAHHDRVRQLGAAQVLDRSTAVKEDYISALDGRELAGIFDAISSEETQLLGIQILSALKEASQPTPSQVALTHEFNETTKSRADAVGVELKMLFGSSKQPQLTPVWQSFVKAVQGDRGLLAQGVIQTGKPELVPGGLAALPAALRRVLKGVSGIRLVINPQES